MHDDDLRMLAHAAPQPWKNGGGTTRELLAWPPSGDWQVRVSVADIERDGPFSPFPGVARRFAVLEGAGVDLHFAGRTVRCRADDADACAFDGAEAPDARLVAGATRDLNLMLRGGWRGGLERVRSREPQTPRGLFAIAAGVLKLEGRERPIPPMTLWWPQAAVPGPATFDGSGWWLLVEEVST